MTRRRAFASNPDARYLSERNQKGSGNTLKRETRVDPQIPSLMPVGSAWASRAATDLAALQAGVDTGDQEARVHALPPAEKIFYFAAPRPPRPESAPAAAVARENGRISP